jgi:hypothetical protein
VDFGLLLSNLANPPVLFFFLGMIAAWVKSDLESRRPHRSSSRSTAARDRV